MHAHTTNYLDDGNPRRHLLHRGFWLAGVPRLILICRLFGHRPVVDGTDGGVPHRWVVCDRCGVRPNPQGSLDPEKWAIGQRYTGECATRVYQPEWDATRPQHVPGPWPASPTGELGCEIVLGRRATMGAGITVGSAGAAQVLDIDFGIGGLFHLYLQIGTHGQWIQRRLIPRGYDSRQCSVHVHDGRVWTELWAREHEWSSDDPWWMHGSLHLNPLDILFGERRYTYEDCGEPVQATVRMPEGDTHQVTLRLRRRTYGRCRGRQMKAWTVDWESSAGIPVRNHDWKGNNVLSSAVDVPDRDVYSGCWAAVACSLIAMDCSRDRARYSYVPPAPAEPVTA